jgi:hypothetical protein
MALVYLAAVDVAGAGPFRLPSADPSPHSRTVRIVLQGLVQEESSLLIIESFIATVYRGSED